MTDQERKAMEMALEALKLSADTTYSDTCLAVFKEAIQALRQALQRPVKSYTNGEPHYATENPLDIADRAYFAGKKDGIAETLAKPKQAHTDHPMPHWDRTCPACVAEQEPVMEVQYFGGRQVYVLLKPLSDGAKLYTAPPSKQWVSLTDEEMEKATRISVDELLDHIYENGTTAEGVGYRVNRIVKAIEAALRSKNT